MRRALQSPLAVLGVIVLLLAVGFAVYQLYPRHGAERVKRLVDWDSSCHVVVHDGRRYVYAERWRGVQDSAVVACEHLGPSVFYARFHDQGALRRVLRASPPLDRTCLYGDAELVADHLDARAEFDALCSDLDGRLRSAPPDSEARLKQLFRERRRRDRGAGSQVREGEEHDH